MKKILVLVVVAMMTAINVNAQSDDLKNEISISYGAGSVSMIGDGIGNSLGNGFFDSILGYKWTNDKQFGSIGVEYFRHLNNPRLAVGGIVTFSRYGEDVEKDNQKIGERTRCYISLMPSVKYYWVNGRNFGFYSKVAAGAMLTTSKSKNLTANTSSNDSKIFFTGQISAIGLEAGSPNFRAFLEGGYGEQGIMLAGVRVKF